MRFAQRIGVLSRLSIRLINSLAATESGTPLCHNTKNIRHVRAQAAVSSGKYSIIYFKCHNKE